MTGFELYDCLDLGLIAGLHRRCLDEPWDAVSISRMLAAPGVHCLAGGLDEKVFGFIICRIAADEGEILIMGVDPKFRRLGLGEALLKAALARLAATGAKKAFLEAAKDNQAALRLYYKLGFTEVGRRSLYYPQKTGSPKDALVLERRLP